MRLVILYTYGDGYTYWATATVPVIYDSPEQFMVDFEKVCKDCYQKSIWSFDFAGKEWECSLFFEEGEYEHPTIMTLDEWFGDTQ